MCLSESEEVKSGITLHRKSAPRRVQKNFVEPEQHQKVHKALALQFRRDILTKLSQRWTQKLAQQIQSPEIPRSSCLAGVSRLHPSQGLKKCMLAIHPLPSDEPVLPKGSETNVR